MNIFGRTTAGRGASPRLDFARTLNPFRREVKALAAIPITHMAPRPALAAGIGTVFPVGEWPNNYVAQVREAYLHNAVAQRAVRLVAEGVAALPLNVSPGDEAALALLKATSAGQVLMESVAMHLLLHGNAFVQILADSSGDVGELFALRPERVSIETDARGWPKSFRYRINNAESRLRSEDALGRALLVHLKGIHPLDDHYGLGCLGAASGAIATHNAATKWNKFLLDNMARPSGALVYEPGEAGATLTNEQFERLRAEIDAHFSGPVNAGRPLLLEGGLKWQALSLSPTDMDFINLKAASAREIALAFGVPPVLLGLPGDATYSNYREANRALYRMTILPMAQKILSAVAEALRGWWPDLVFSVDMDGVSALADDREKLWQQVSAANFLTNEEKRSMLGLAPGSLELSENNVETEL